MHIFRMLTLRKSIYISYEYNAWNKFLAFRNHPWSKDETQDFTIETRF